jgi:hypothetical protein
MVTLLEDSTWLIQGTLVDFTYAQIMQFSLNPTNILWRVSPMREPLKLGASKHSRRTSVYSSLPGYAVSIGSRNSKEGQTDLRDVTRNNTQSYVLRVVDSSVDRRD